LAGYRRDNDEIATGSRLLNTPAETGNKKDADNAYANQFFIAVQFASPLPNRHSILINIYIVVEDVWEKPNDDTFLIPPLLCHGQDFYGS
jgi:hypothetical protein